MEYDIIVIGGGLCGSAFAKAMADQGANVLVIESEMRFRDRVRGEWLSPRGVQEARKLSILDEMIDAGAHELRYMRAGTGEPRDIQATSACGEPGLSFYHPAMQEAVLHSSISAGAEVWRGTRARVQTQNGKVAVVAEKKGVEVELHARLVVAADGRNSATRQRMDFRMQQGASHLSVAGLLFDALPAPEDTVHTWRDSWADPPSAIHVLIFPQGEKRVRAYVACPQSANYRLSGRSLIPKFVELCLRAGAPPEYFAHAQAVGPLAGCPGKYLWAEQAYRSGVALVGDAAAITDPNYGRGISVALRDARVLRDRLLEHDNWDEAARAYAEEHARYTTAIRLIESWTTEILYSVGAEAGARREKVQAAWMEDPARRIDPDCGLEQIPDEAARVRFFAEDV